MRARLLCRRKQARTTRSASRDKALAPLPRKLGELVPCQTKTPAFAVEHQVHEALVTAVEEADHVVLLPQRQHDILDLIIELPGVRAPQCRQGQLFGHSRRLFSNRS